MEEELNENELEERFYSMLHHVDDSQSYVTNSQDALKIIENAPRSTLRRYWRTSGDHTNTTPLNTPFQKVNIPKEAPKTTIEDTKPKEEKVNNIPEPLPKHLAFLNAPVPKNVEKSIEIIENEESNVVELESSDEDEVVEVALPPKPTITIESSDDEIPIIDTPTKAKRSPVLEKRAHNGDREISASPVPSIVSSVSDDFIRGDCIAFNISSRRPEDSSFDFSLHGADILDSTPSKKKKKKKNKESATSTPIAVAPTPIHEECFATPKSKAKNKKQKNKSYVVTEKSVPSIDVYDSDSNQSIIETNKTHQAYVVTDKSVPSADVYETDSSETPRTYQSKATETVDVDSSDSSISLDKSKQNVSKKDASQITEVTIDLTQNTPVDHNIVENIVIGNVTGFTECEDYDDVTPKQITEPKFGSTKVPAILYENLDFDNLKGKEKVCKNRRYSLTTLRAEMEKFYNESWGGENFNHREIQKNMSRDKSLWAIDPKDRMGSYTRKKFNIICNYCNTPGHRDDTCRLKPPVCFMCGTIGHMEPRCPKKICVNCGSPNHMYSTMCRNCCYWGRIKCVECGQIGHPQTHCPDIWRRYHNTIDVASCLEENHYSKKPHQLFCSGCTRRGHLVHTCRISLPFSGLPINSPYVQMYKPVYSPVPDTKTANDNQRNKQHVRNFQDSTISSATTPTSNLQNKRQSKSPTVHESHVNKKKNMSISEISEQNPKSPRPEPQRKRSHSKEPTEVSENVAKQQQKIPEAQSFETMEKAPDFIPIFSSNHDDKGQVIQDNEVSDTSDVVTSARIYVTSDVIERLKSKEGYDWLKETTDKLHVVVDAADNNLFLNVKGKFDDQDAFKLALRDWALEKPVTQQTHQVNDLNTSQQSESGQTLSDNIPKNRNNVLRKLKNALESLNKDIGEPNELYKELMYLQNRHEQLLKQNVISPKQLGNNKDNINMMLKKLNMVLLGQAGLADGPLHIKELYSLQEKLINGRTKKISLKMRQDIGEHFHRIFTAMPRNDYGQLLQSYNMLQTKKPIKKNKKKTFTNNSKPKQLETIPVQEKYNNSNYLNAGDENRKPKMFKSQNETGKFFAEKMKNKMIFYYKRLCRARPNDSVLKKTRVELVRKLHSSIGSLSMNPMTSSKSLKKMKKVQEQAQLFLSNV